MVMLVAVSSVGCSSSERNEARQSASVACRGKIASFVPLTGPSAAVGVNGNNGVILAVEQFRARNPACTIDLVIKDSPQVAPSKAQDIARELADDPTIIGVVGPAYSADAAVADSILSDAGLTFIIPIALLSNLSTQGDATFHRIIGNNAAHGLAAARYLNTTLWAKKTFTVDEEKTAFSKEIVKAVQENTSVVGSATFQTGQTDFSAIVSQIIAAGADAVFFGGYYTEAGLLVRQLRQAGSTAFFLGAGGVLDSAYLTTAGVAAEGSIIFSSAIPPEKVEGNFAADYQAKYNRLPDYYAAESFDATNVFLEGIKAGHTTRSAMENFVDNYEGRGLTGRIEFGDDGEIDPYLVSVWANKVQNGRITADQEMYAAPRTGS